ncbi:MAG: hypothetical protein C4524_07410 [Candidatus Zixiibacteriota bacterium]|nr:MAG: hypothetical protein C4524_07410 [candidate division Zixibacteria bacterium]
MSDRMWEWLDGFPQQVSRAAEMSQNWDLALDPPANIAFLGIGGSAIGADLVCNLYRAELSRPAAVARGEAPPAWLGPDSLAVATSYSGETRETLAAFTRALDRGARGICISSGGTLMKLAWDRDLPRLQIPAGMAPRAALGYTSFPLIRVLQAAGAIPGQALELDNLLRPLNSLRLEWGNPDGPGAGVGRRLLRRLPIIVGLGFTSVAVRRCQAQLAENAKAMSVPFEVPEALHNLVETLDAAYLETFRPVALYLEDMEASEADKKVMKAVRETFQQAGVEGIPILTQGKTPLERLFTLIHKVDWISWHLAALKGVDPVAIPNIMGLKGKL